MKIAIIGKSRVGLSIAQALRRGIKGYELVSIVSARALLRRDPQASSTMRPARLLPTEVDILLIATKDSEIANVSRLVTKSIQPKLIAHFAGSLPSSILTQPPPIPRLRKAGGLMLTMHPIQTFPKANASKLNGITWMLSSDNADAIKLGKRFTKALGAGGIITVDVDQLSLYHAATVFASNFITLLGSSVEQLAKELDLDPAKFKKSLRPLMETSLQNVLAKNAKDVLTGPIVRNDLETIKRHQKALKQASPELRKLYDAFLGIV